MKDRMSRLISHIALLLCALLLVPLLAGCKSSSKGKKAKGKQAKKGKKKSWRELWKKRRNRAKPVHGVRLHNGAISSLLTGTTTLTAEQQVTVVTQVNGLVSSLYGKEGRRVRRGSTLARLSNPYLVIAHERAKLEVQKLARDLKRQKRLLRKGIVSREAAENLRFQYAKATNQLKRTKQDLANLRIRATISGVVTKRMLQKGAWVTPQIKGFNLENPRSIVAQVAVPERYLPRLKKGLPAFLQAEALGRKRKITGEVVRVAPSVDAKTGTVTVTIGKIKPLKSLRSGMFVTIQIVLERRKNVPLLPKVAVSYYRNKAFVFRLKDKKKPCQPPHAPVKCKAEKVYIEKGLENAEWVEVRSGVQAGDRVIILGQQGLRTSHKVRVVQWQKLKPAT